MNEWEASNYLTLRVRTLAFELPLIKIDKRATVEDLIARLSKHVSILATQRLCLTYLTSDQQYVELKDESKKLESCGVKDGADVCLTIKGYPVITQKETESLFKMTRNLQLRSKPEFDPNQISKILDRRSGALNIRTPTEHIDQFLISLSTTLTTNCTITSLKLDFKQQKLNSDQEKNCHVYKLRDHSVVKLAVALKHNNTITELNLSNNNINITGMCAIADMMTHNTTIEKLNLSNNNQIGIDCTTQLVNAVTKTWTVTDLGIKKFELNETVLSRLLDPDDCKLQRLEIQLTKQAAELMRHNTTITDYNLSLSFIDNPLQKMLDLCILCATNATLQTLDLSDNKIKDREIALLCDALIAAQNSITAINLRNNCFHHRGVIALANMLSHNSKLISLDLSDNQLGWCGFQSFTRALTDNQVTVLQDLDLSENFLSERDSREIVEMLKSNSTLTKLRMSNNKIGDAGVKLICKALAHNSTIKMIDVRYNNGSTQFGTKIQTKPCCDHHRHIIVAE